VRASALGTLALGAVIVLGATAQTMAPGMTGARKMSQSRPILVRLAAQNGSGESGTATLSDGRNGAIVRLRMNGASVAQPAHIHRGTCAHLDPQPAFPLKLVQVNQFNTSSDSTIPGVTIAQLRAAPYAINVHMSTTNLAAYVACGNIPRLRGGSRTFPGARM
jgi:hypothetical protein